MAIKAIAYRSFIAFFALLLLTSCSTIKQATSEAYRLGYETGESFKKLGDLGNVIDSYFPDDSKLNSGDFNSEDVSAYCEGTWMITGIAAGLENTDSNKSDYVQGCVDGLKGSL
jgi:hypothetical protein